MSDEILSSLARLYVPEPLHDHATLTLEKPQAHYLSSVLRQTEGDEILLFNGEDGEWRGKITEIDRKSALITLIDQTRPQIAEPDVWLYFAPIKFGRIDYLVQKATELGVSHIHPVQTHRTIVNRINEDRLIANVIEAAEQSERLTLPEIIPYQPLANLLDTLPDDRVLIYCDETGRGAPPATLLPKLHNKKLSVLVGPEGGFATEELDALHEHPFAQAMSLGPRVLRADTAAVAALSCIMALCGDWQEGRPGFSGAV